MNLTTQSLQEQYDPVGREFEQQFGAVPEWLATAPGRVNLMGEHTDYNLLPVLPMTIDRKIRLYGRTRPDSIVNIQNKKSAYPGSTIDLAAPIAPVPGHWTNYARAALQAVLPAVEAERPGAAPVGFDLLVDSDLPAAAGLSSSSALVIATCMAALQANGLTWGARKMAEAMTEAEKFVGTAGGGMDQAAISLGEEGSALLVEFDPLATQAVAVPSSLSVFIINSGEKAEKTGAARFSYNRRALECRIAVAILARRCGDLFAKASSWTSLRDVYAACGAAGVSWSELLVRHLPADAPGADALTKILGADDLRRLCASRQLDPDAIDEWLPEGQFQVYSRAAHVLSEADRVYGFRDALVAADLPVAGLIANTSHRSCRDLYHISTPRLESLVKLAMESGALGARITGAGFGGCLVAFVAADQTEKFSSDMIASGLTPEDLIKAKPGGRAAVQAFQPATA